MNDSDRTRRLEDELKMLAAPADTARRDRLLTSAGVLLMLTGIGVAIAGYAISATTSDPLRQSDGRALGPIAITLAVLGLALFLRFSATRFLRFWMARLIAERADVRPAHMPGPDGPVQRSPTTPTATGEPAGTRED